MRLLLDTHIAIWALTAPDKLTAVGQDLIARRENTIFVSVVSLWEIAVKRAIGKASAPPFSAAAALRFFGEAGFSILDVSAAHAIAVEDLPLRHGDPFDRFLVAQALTEPMRMLTRDPQVAAYSELVTLV